MATALSTPAELPALQMIETLSRPVIRILGGNPGKFTLQGTNTYLIGTGPRRLLIDTGDPSSSWANLLGHVLRKEGSVLDGIILTHRHADHVSGLQAALRHCPPETKVYKHLPPNANINEAKAKLGLSAADDDDDDERELLPVRDGQTFSVEGVTLRALHTPGHTEDHIVLHFENDEHAEDGGGGVVVEEGVFTGDNVLGHGTAVFEDLEEYTRSLKTMLEVFRDRRSRYVPRRSQEDDRGGSSSDDVVSMARMKIPAYPGHGELIQDGEARVEEYIAHRVERERQVLHVLSARHRSHLECAETQPEGARTQSEEAGAQSEAAPAHPEEARTRQPESPEQDSNGGSTSAIPGMSPSEIVRAVYPDLHPDLRRAAERGVLLILNKLGKEGRVEPMRDASPLEGQGPGRKSDGDVDGGGEGKWILA